MALLLPALRRRGIVVGFLVSVLVIILFLGHLSKKPYHPTKQKWTSESIPHHSAISEAIPPLTVLMVFPLLKTDALKKQGYNVSDKELANRELEYIESLKLNLQLTSVDSIHLFSHRKDLLRATLVQYNVDMRRLHLRDSSPNPTYTDLFKYASDFLQQNLVLIMNADLILGEGFQRIDKLWWRKNTNVCYALTRHTITGHEARCNMNTVNYCDKNGTYVGSHDAFMFFLSTPLTDNFLGELNFPSHSFGSENVVIWALRKHLHYSVSNPCRRLVMYHNHCSNLRVPYEKRPRVDVGGKNEFAPFTD